MSNKNTFNSATKNAAEAVDALTKKTQTKIVKKCINLKLKKPAANQTGLPKKQQLVIL